MVEDNYSDSSTKISELRSATIGILELSQPSGPVLNHNAEKTLVKEKKKTSSWDTALRLIGVRARSCDELRRRLLAKEFSSDEVEQTIARLLAHKLLDDEEFAQQWVRSRHLYSGKGAAVLRRELQIKGVEQHLIETALQQISTESECEKARELLERKTRHLDGASLVGAERQKYLRRFVALLLRRGYSPAMAFETAKSVMDGSTGGTGS